MEFRPLLNFSRRVVQGRKCLNFRIPSLSDRALMEKVPDAVGLLNTYCMLDQELSANRVRVSACSELLGVAQCTQLDVQNACGQLTSA
eukprot:3351800-Alexandrium_andersonii.AAC.1